MTYEQENWMRSAVSKGLETLRTARRLAPGIAGAFAVLGAACGHSPDPAAVASAPDPFTAPAPRPGKPLPPLPPTSDGKVALERMVAAYHKLNALHQTSEADITFRFGGPILAHQQTIIDCERNPPRVALTLKDPVGGTQQYIADGSSVVQYTALTNQYVRRSATPSLAAEVERINKFAPQVMSPLVFLTSSDLPTGVASARLSGAGVVNGKPAVVVEGTFSDAYLRAFGSSAFAKPVQPYSGGFTVWLDKSSYLLLKSSVHLGWRGRTSLHTSPGQFADPAMDFTETVVDLVQNPSLSPDIFRFSPPRGAKEVFVEGREAGS